VRGTGLAGTALAACVLCGACTRPDVRTNPAAPGATAPKTLTFSILEDYDKGDDLSDIVRDFELFAELNVRTWRGSFGWDDYEPEQGRYDFSWLHEFMLTAARHGISLRPYVGYTPAWAAGGKDADGQAWNQPPRSQAVWTAFARALGSEIGHHPNVRSLEIYNEENVQQWWEGSADDYGSTLGSAASAVRGLELVMGGLVFPDLEWIEALCDDERVRNAFTVLPVHAYPETWTPEGVTVENYLGEGFRKEFLPAADRLCGPKRIWINETGFATTPGKTEEDQAAWWARAIATFAAEPRVEHIGIYEIKDLAPDRPAIGDAPNYHLGLTRVDRTKKLAFSTVKMLVELIGTQPFSLDAAKVQRSATTGDLHHHYFSLRDQTALLVVWNRTADEGVRVHFPRDGRVVEYALDGTTSPRTLQDRALDIGLRRGVPRIFLLGSP
jgi:hypothetical protein